MELEEEHQQDEQRQPDEASIKTAAKEPSGRPTEIITQHSELSGTQSLKSVEPKGSNDGCKQQVPAQTTPWVAWVSASEVVVVTTSEVNAPTTAAPCNTKTQFSSSKTWKPSVGSSAKEWSTQLDCTKKKCRQHHNSSDWQPERESFKMMRSQHNH